MTNLSSAVTVAEPAEPLVPLFNASALMPEANATDAAPSFPAAEEAAADDLPDCFASWVPIVDVYGSSLIPAVFNGEERAPRRQGAKTDRPDLQPRWSSARGPTAPT